ncbi:MAG: serine hydrolase [bacterium]
MMKYLIALLWVVTDNSSLFSGEDHQTTFLTHKIDSILKARDIAGCQAALFTSDTLLWMKSFGIRDRKNKAAVTADDLFRMGSVTKTFVAVAVMQLVEQGKLSLDDQVQELPPEISFENPWEATDPLRVFHLLEAEMLRVTY